MTHFDFLVLGFMVGAGSTLLLTLFMLRSVKHALTQRRKVEK